MKSLSTIDEVVLETIYKLAATNPPAHPDDKTFSGYPLAARARSAPLIFYVLWPLATIVAWWLVRR
jgi:hypothetical protein